MKSRTLHVSINVKKIINNQDECLSKKNNQDENKQGKDLAKSKLGKLYIKKKMFYLGKMNRTSIGP